MESTNARFFSSSLFFFSHINKHELVSYLHAFILLILEQIFKHFSSYFLQVVVMVDGQQFTVKIRFPQWDNWTQASPKNDIQRLPKDDTQMI